MYASRLMAIVNVRKDVALMKSIIVDVTMSVKKHIERSDDQTVRNEGTGYLITTIYTNRSLSPIGAKSN